MAKRFTDTGKWMNKWYRALSPTCKLAWDYLCDNCDVAGVIDLDQELANFQIGESVNWDVFLSLAEARIRILPSGKWMLTGFIKFQYGRLSAECKPHIPIIEALKRHGIKVEEVEQNEGYRHSHQRLSESLSERLCKSLEEKEKEKEQDKEMEMEGGVGETTPPAATEPATFEESRDRFTALWNAAPGVRAVTVMSGRRVAMLRKRLVEQVVIGDERVAWLDGLQRMLNEKFPLQCTRGSPGSWMPDVDWILEETSLPAIIEGKYDWEKKADGRQRSIGPGQRHDSSTATRPPSIGW